MASKIEIGVVPEKCTGCRICELVCSAGKHEEFNPKRSRVRIVKEERFFIDVPSICRHCSRPLCLKGCDSAAIEKTKEGYVVVDQEKCIGCEACIAACPFDSIFMDPVENKAIVCDLCQGHPKCVQWCPTQALVLQQDISAAERKKTSSPNKEARRLIERWKIPMEEWERYHPKKKRTN